MQAQPLLLLCCTNLLVLVQRPRQLRLNILCWRATCFVHLNPCLRRPARRDVISQYHYDRSAPAGPSAASCLTPAFSCQSGQSRLQLQVPAGHRYRVARSGLATIILLSGCPGIPALAQVGFTAILLPLIYQQLYLVVCGRLQTALERLPHIQCVQISLQNFPSNVSHSPAGHTCILCTALPAWSAHSIPQPYIGILLM